MGVDGGAEQRSVLGSGEGLRGGMLSGTIKAVDPRYNFKVLG